MKIQTDGKDVKLESENMEERKTIKFIFNLVKDIDIIGFNSNAQTFIKIPMRDILNALVELKKIQDGKGGK
jgi:hypothetical protein